MKKVRCVSSKFGCNPPCLEGDEYECVDEFSYGSQKYYRIRFENGTESNVDSRDFEFSHIDLDDLRTQREFQN